MIQNAHKKLENVKQYIISLESVAVAFSGGVDSTFLLKVAHDALGSNAVAITARSPSFPEREFTAAADFCKKEHIVQYTFDSDELSIPTFSQNPKNRCYLCKHELFEKMRALATEHKLSFVCEGSNTDDMGDYRPGLAAVEELGIKSPLRHAGLCKEEIRLLSKELGLPTWNKQSFACLASRFVYGESISPKKLAMVDKAEQFLLDSGFTQVRVRIHGEALARIEVLPQEMEKVLAHKEAIFLQLKQFGFSYISLDLQGYRTGSMNELILSQAEGV